MRSQHAAIAANRFGLGARPGDDRAIGPDPRGWLRVQLGDAAPASGAAASPAKLVEIASLRLARQFANPAAPGRRPGATDPNERPPLDPAFREYLGYVGSSYRQQVAARFQTAVATDAPFRERLVRFWANHFAISADKQPIGAIAFDFVNEAIRPHVTGNFLDMLIAVEQHPAMLLYLDNQRSIGPNSRVARAAVRFRGPDLGLNENLAREILELHTLGVDGGYGQDDVTEFARVITGWSIGGQAPGGRGPFASGTPGTFEFRELMHEPGAKHVLGRRISEAGIDEGLQVLAMLASHQATALHIARKLAVHFVSDDPSAALVGRLARVFLETGGELAPVYEALIDENEAWQVALTKFRTPDDYVTSVIRALGQSPADAERLLPILTQLGQRPLTPGSPAGWPDTAEHWDGGDALLKRIEWASAIGRGVGDRVSPIELADAVLGPVASSATRQAVARAESAAQGLTLLLAAPEFQRR